MDIKKLAQSQEKKAAAYLRDHEADIIKAMGLEAHKVVMSGKAERVTLKDLLNEL